MGRCRDSVLSGRHVFQSSCTPQDYAAEHPAAEHPDAACAFKLRQVVSLFFFSLLPGAISLQSHVERLPGQHTKEYPIAHLALMRCSFALRKTHHPFHASLNIATPRSSASSKYANRSGSSAARVPRSSLLFMRMSSAPALREEFQHAYPSMHAQCTP